MTIEPIQRLYCAEPFHPFVMHLADGREVPVHHRELMASAPNGRTVLVYQPGSSFNIIDLLLVTDVEVRAGGAKSGNNGS